MKKGTYKQGMGVAYIEVMLGVIEGQIEGHVGVVDVNVDELDDIFVVDLAQELQSKGKRRERDYSPI